MIDIIKRHLAAFGTGDWNAYKAELAPNAIYDEQATMQRAKGADEYVKAVQVWKRGFPDLKANILNTIAAGNMVVAEVEWEGTNSGQLAGPMGMIAPTNKHGSVRAAIVFKLENNKIVESHHYFDLMTVLRQLGVVPQIGAPGQKPGAAPEQRR